LFVETVSRQGVLGTEFMQKLTFRVTVTTVVNECGDWPIHGTKTPDGYLRCLRAVRSADPLDGRDAVEKSDNDG
jgi:hypothetical protein